MEVHDTSQNIFMQGTIFTTLIMITRYEYTDITINNPTYMIQLQTYYEITSMGIELASMGVTMRRVIPQTTHTYIILQEFQYYIYLLLPLLVYLTNNRLICFRIIITFLLLIKFQHYLSKSL